MNTPTWNLPLRPKRRGYVSLEEHVEELGDIVTRSKHLVVYTGAGISTSAGIPDYRGPAGVWVLRSQGKRPPPVDYAQAQPTTAHRALALLVQTGLVKHVVTQNVDGLHRESGVPEGKLSELHGNARKERCEECGKEYLREYPTWSITSASGSTAASARVQRKRPAQPSPPSGGRRCDSPGCAGLLRHCVTLFGEPLPDSAVLIAERETARADVALVLGSSLKVGPACDYPSEVVARGGKLVIVNLQSTPLDGRADMVMRATCDHVMQLLVRNLGLSMQLHQTIDGSECSTRVATVICGLEDRPDCLL